MLTAKMLDVEKDVNGKFIVKFDLLLNGTSIAECKSSPVWGTREAAASGGRRAADCLNKTGRFPDMCKVW